jgi:putative PIN family toxin of toxin-antitoxin system
VLDTNVSLALFAWADLSCAALATALLEQRLRAVVNAATRAEWLRILERPELRLDATVLARAAAAFDELVVDVETEHSPAPLALPRCRDPDDQMFLELAHASGAIALYSRDRELLKLSRRTQRLAGFAVLRPEDHRD